MRETLNVILSTSEESVAVVRKAGKLSSEVIDSSLCVTVPFSVFPTRHSCLRAEWRRTASVILNECEGSITVMRGDGKKIKAISYQL